GQVHGAVGQLGELEHLHDRGVPHPAGGLGLLPEAGELLALAALTPEDLERHPGTPSLRTTRRAAGGHHRLGLVHAPHPALAQQAQDAGAISHRGPRGQPGILGRSQRAEAKRPRLRAGPRFGTRSGTGPIQRTHRAPRGRTGPCRRRRRRLHRPTVSPGRQRVLYASLVAKATEKIDALLARLEQSGADPQRLDALRRTQRFKRSWVDLAQTLVEIRRSASFQAWGYDDFYAYCTQELFLKRPTVDKL